MLTTYQKPTVHLTEVIAPAFYSVHADVKAGLHTYYKLPGGRGSCKSSFAGTEIPLGIMQDALAGKFTNAAVLRRVEKDVRDSVFNQIQWSIDKLGVSHLWKPTLSPLRLTYTPTGQQIIFRGADDPTKIKSIKVKKGYIKYLWFEELDEFEGPEKIRNIQQSVLRGGDKFVVFYTFNPPRSQKSWVNDPTAFSMPDMLECHTNYLTVPREWLGKQFFLDAEHLKQVKPEAYKHEYMGVATGTGGEVFQNVRIQTITDEDIKQIPRFRFGIDWGFATDPFVWIACGYDRKKHRLIIFDEIYEHGMSNKKAAAEIVKHHGMQKDIVCDSAEPKSIAEVRTYGLRVRGAKKGPDSVDYGIHWLQDLDEIIIDDKRAPNAAREFYGYELDRDAKGNLKAEYPDHDNHTIDAVRYACEDDMSKSGTHIGW